MRVRANWKKSSKSFEFSSPNVLIDILILVTLKTLPSVAHLVNFLTRRKRKLSMEFIVMSIRQLPHLMTLQNSKIQQLQSR
jgi:hypothetical protein